MGVFVSTGWVGFEGVSVGVLSFGRTDDSGVGNAWVGVEVEIGWAMKEVGGVVEAGLFPPQLVSSKDNTKQVRIACFVFTPFSSTLQDRVTRFEIKARSERRRILLAPGEVEKSANFLSRMTALILPTKLLRYKSPEKAETTVKINGTNPQIRMVKTRSVIFDYFVERKENLFSMPAVE